MHTYVFIYTYNIWPSTSFSVNDNGYKAFVRTNLNKWKRNRKPPAEDLQIEFKQDNYLTQINILSKNSLKASMAGHRPFEDVRQCPR